MSTYDNEFLDIFNEHYPFKRYIVKEPKSIGNLFDDLVLTEIFVPETEIKPILGNNNSLITFTTIPKKEVYIKVKGKAGEMRLGYFDFEEYIREQIRYIIIEDLGPYEYECLYVDNEDQSSILKELRNQYSLIKKKYGICEIKQTIADKTFAKIELYDNTVKNNNPSKIELSFDSFYSDNPYVEMIDYE